MSRNRSEIGEMKSAFGRSKDLLFALLEGIEDAGGNEDDIARFVKEPELRMQVARLIVGGPRPTFKLRVDFDDPGHRLVDPGHFQNADLDPSIFDQRNYPIVRTGIRDIVVEFLTVDPKDTIGLVLGQIASRRDIGLPDMAITRTMLKTYPAEAAAPYISLCGREEFHHSSAIYMLHAELDCAVLKYRFLGEHAIGVKRVLVERTW